MGRKSPVLISFSSLSSEILFRHRAPPRTALYPEIPSSLANFENHLFIKICTLVFLTGENAQPYQIYRNGFDFKKSMNGLILLREHAKLGEALRSDVDVLSALRQTQILIECLSTDTKIPGHLCFLLTFCYVHIPAETPCHALRAGR